jgi:isopentenyldiphosphate isomerase
MAELYQIVDEHDNPTGFKLRNEIDFQRDYYRVSGLWLTNSIGQVLIAQRVLTKDKDPGKWGPAAAGTVEKDETYEANMYKEAEEELGLTGVKFTTGPKMRIESPRKYFLQWFTALVDMPEEEFTPQPSEVERVMWIAQEALIQDVAEKPDIYVPSMPVTIEAFCIK